MTHYQIEFLDPEGRTARQLFVRCGDILEAHRLVAAPDCEAVLIRPVDIAPSRADDSSITAGATS